MNAVSNRRLVIVFGVLLIGVFGAAIWISSMNGSMHEYIWNAFNIVPIIPPAFLVLFTYLLFRATEEQHRATAGLLEQSRRAFVVNFVSESINNGINMRLSGKAPDWVGPYVRALHNTIMTIDEELAGHFEAAWRSYVDQGEWAQMQQLRQQINRAFGDE